MPEIRRAAQRFHTVGEGVQTWHSFSYGVHYDPEQIGFGPLMAINLEHLEPGAGYDVHGHVDVEIVTWVLEGTLRHEDSTGQCGDIGPGTAQRLSAGTGVRHSERNISADESLRFVQMMLRSDRDGGPEYAQADIVPAPGALVPAVDVHAPAQLFVAWLEAGQHVTVPAAPSSLLIVTEGSIAMDDVVLGRGDEVRFAGQGAYELTATTASQALVWQLETT